MSKTRPPEVKPAPHPPGHDPDRDEHGHFIRNRMDTNQVRPWLMWLGFIVLAAKIGWMLPVL